MGVYLHRTYTVSFRLYYTTEGGRRRYIYLEAKTRAIYAEELPLLETVSLYIELKNVMSVDSELVSQIEIQSALKSIVSVDSPIEM